jgi:hypothetical protein
VETYYTQDWLAGNLVVTVYDPVTFDVTETHSFVDPTFTSFVRYAGGEWLLSEYIEGTQYFRHGGSLASLSGTINLGDNSPTDNFFFKNDGVYVIAIQGYSMSKLYSTIDWITFSGPVVTGETPFQSAGNALMCTHGDGVVTYTSDLVTWNNVTIPVDYYYGNAPNYIFFNGYWHSVVRDLSFGQYLAVQSSLASSPTLYPLRGSEHATLVTDGVNLYGVSGGNMYNNAYFYSGQNLSTQEDLGLSSETVEDVVCFGGAVYISLNYDLSRFVRGSVNMVGWPALYAGVTLLKQACAYLYVQPHYFWARLVGAAEHP